MRREPMSCRRSARNAARVTVMMTSASSEGWKLTNDSEIQRRDPRTTGPRANTAAIETSTNAKSGHCQRRKCS